RISVPGNRGAHGAARSGDVRLDLAVLAVTTARGGGQTVARVVVTDRVRDGPGARRSGRVAAQASAVAVGEDTEDAGGVPVLDDVLHERLVAGRLGAPRVVDDVRRLRRVRVGAVQLGGCQHPLTRVDQGSIARAAAVRGDPRRSGSHADLVLTAVVTHHGAGDVSAVPVGVGRLARRGACGVIPVVVVGEGAITVVAAVVVHQSGVVVLRTGVDAADHDALPADAEVGPDVVGIDVADAPIHGGGCHDRLVPLQLGDLDLEGRVDALHSGVRGKRSDEGLVPAGDSDRVGGPERLVVDAVGVELCADLLLALLRGAGQRFVQGDAPLVAVLHALEGRHLRAGVETHPEVGGALLLDLGGHLRVDLVGSDLCLW